MKRIIKWAIIGVVLIGISWMLYSLANPSRPPADMAVSGAISFDVTTDTLINTVEVKGKSVYEQEHLVYAPYGAKIDNWNVKNGEQVEQGETLFQLDRTALQDQIDQAEAEMQRALLEEKLSAFVSENGEQGQSLGTTEAERKQALAKMETDRLTLELNQVKRGIQQKELARMRKKLGEASYTSPMSGIFLFENASKVPQMAGDQQYLGKIVNLGKLQMIVNVGENDIFRIKEDMPVAVRVQAMKDLKLSGKVTSVSKFARSGAEQSNTDQAAQFEVIISLEPNEHLLAGLSLTGDIEISRKENVVVVPTLAVLREKDQHYVMLDTGSGAYERRNIRIGQETPDKTEVVEGLQAGDKVVLQ